MSGITGGYTTGKGVGKLIDGYVAKYLRISDDDVDVGKGKDESGSISNQRDVLQYFINNHEELSKYPVREFLDDGYSGVNFNRPGVQNLLKEVKENKVACIVVKDLSRFGRNYLEVGDYIEQIFPFLGVRCIAITDNYDSFKNSGGIEIGFKNLIHDMYSRDLSKYLCRMGDSCGFRLRIRVQDLEGAVLEILEKLVSVQREAEVKREENRCRAISEITKIKEEKRILEMKMEHCKTSRLNLYRQWKEQQITKDEYIGKRDGYTEQEERHQVRRQKLDERLGQLMAEQEAKKPDCDLQVYSGIQSLTKEMADELIERIDVYDGDRVEITWKFENPIQVLSEDNDLRQ